MKIEYSIETWSWTSHLYSTFQLNFQFQGDWASYLLHLPHIWGSDGLPSHCFLRYDVSPCTQVDSIFEHFDIWTLEHLISTPCRLHITVGIYLTISTLEYLILENRPLQLEYIWICRLHITVAMYRQEKADSVIRDHRQQKMGQRTLKQGWGAEGGPDSNSNSGPPMLQCAMMINSLTQDRIPISMTINDYQSKEAVRN